MAPVAKGIAENLPEGAEFVKNHVNFLGGVSPQAQSNLSFAYLIAKKHGQAEAVTAQIFKSIHIQRAPLTEIAPLSNVLFAHQFQAPFSPVSHDQCMVLNLLSDSLQQCVGPG